jgi:proline iminopeptidase
MTRQELSTTILCSTLAVVLCLSCYSADVRMGMGEGEGVRLSYRIVGNGKPLIVIHDGPGYEKTLMYPGFDGLRSEVRVIYYDQRGCGRSAPLSPTTSLSIDDNIADLEALRRYFYLDRFSIAAHGWGAVIALEYARRYEQHIDSIILITPISPFSPDPEIDSIVEKLPPEGKEAVVMAVNDPRISMLERRKRIMKAVMPALFYDRHALGKVDLGEVRYSPDVSIRLSDELKTLDLFPVLGEIGIPTLVVVGRHDISIPVRDQMAYADGISTASAIVFNSSGHFPFLEEPAFFMTVVKEFLSKKRIPALVSADTVGSEPKN